jgi:hypothetical protein
MSTTKKKIISLEVRDEYILGSGVSIGAVGSFDSVVLRVKFDDSWIGLNIYATWTDALGNVGDQTIITALVLVDGEVDTYDIPVSSFATQHAGTVKLSFSGYAISRSNDKEIDSVVNTVSGAFRVLESNALRLDGGNVDATLAEQLTATVSEMAAKVVEFEDAEEDRDLAENTRGRNEDERIANEAQRKLDEDSRDNAEEERQRAEEERQHAEVLRDSEEIERAARETVRMNAEGDRVAAETKRVEAEIARQQGYQDIGEALDRIIAIQENLMGIIKFSINNVTFKALDGMTWKEWCESEYNTGGYVAEDTDVSGSGGLVRFVDGGTVKPTDKIIANCSYVCSMSN